MKVIHVKKALTNSVMYNTKGLTKKFRDEFLFAASDHTTAMKLTPV